MQRHSTGTPSVAYSYLRFSNREQGRGDSLRRQTEQRDGWLSRNAAVLDTALRLQNRGVSAFRGKHRENPDRHALARFLQLIESGRIQPGSYLLIENLDRLSREDEVPACNLLTSILMAGVKVVQLSPYEMLLTDKSNGWELMRAVMELSRGHGESVLKSERVGGAWRAKKQAARNGGLQPPRRKDGRVTRSVTARLPGWIEDVGGQLMLIPAAAEAVRLIFRLAASGFGNPAILKKLATDNVPPLGACEKYTDEQGEERRRAPDGRRFGSGRWTRAYVQRILRDRRALGEYQPRGPDGTPEGDVIPDFYPAAVTEDEWREARAGAQERRKNPGRVGAAQINIFSGILKHARDGDSYIMTQRLSRTRGKTARKFQILVNGEGDQGRARGYSIPYLEFETAILACLKEIDPHDILNGDHPPDETTALARDLGGVEAELADANVFMNIHGFSVSIGKRIAALEVRQADLTARLEAARHRAEHPLSESWGECQSLADTIAADPRDGRLRLRSALRRVVEGAWLLIVPRGRVRLAAIQLRFTGGRTRNYLISFRAADRHQPGSWTVRSFAGVPGLGDLDLRRREQAQALEPVLEAMELPTG
jgi:DNA invertase Pin-like site-specific DNA recombinase